MRTHLSHHLLSPLLATVLIGAAGASQDLDPLTLELQSGAQMTYFERLPQDAPADRALPLFVCLPPGEANEAMVQAARRHLGDLAWKHGYLTVYPVARGTGFTGDAGFDVLELIDHVSERHTVDRGRIVLAGLSNGGRAVFDIAARGAGKFAALVGAPGARYEGSEIETIGDVPVWIRVGALDTQDWRDGARATAEELRNRNCDVDFAELAGQGHVLVLEEQGLFEWLERQLAKLPDPLRFEAADGLRVDADLYDVSDAAAPTVLLCHQANSSRGEYRSIAPRLAAAGYRAVAIDQRSGRSMNGVRNATAERARVSGKSTEYLDARADIEAAIAGVRERWPDAPVVLWGSSYSASLALVIEPGRDDLAAVLSFAPGEYFGSELSVATALRDGRAPTLVVSPESERPRAQAIVKALSKRGKWVIGPTIQHGSKTLFLSEDPEPVWEAVLAFLAEHTGS